MNPFNAVFLSVKKQCGDLDMIEDEKCFEAVALEANISLDKLDLYLNILQDMELIKFSKPKHYLKVTALGRQREELFTSQSF